MGFGRCYIDAVFAWVHRHAHSPTGVTLRLAGSLVQLDRKFFVSLPHWLYRTDAAILSSPMLRTECNSNYLNYCRGALWVTCGGNMGRISDLGHRTALPCATGRGFIASVDSTSAPATLV